MTCQTLRVTGSVHDVGQAQARMENVVYGYVTLETLALLGEEPYLDQLKILVSGDRFDARTRGRGGRGQARLGGDWATRSGVWTCPSPASTRTPTSWACCSSPFRASACWSWR